MVAGLRTFVKPAGLEYRPSMAFSIDSLPWRLVAALLVFSLACGDDDGGTDAGTDTGGEEDTGTPDTFIPGDAGPTVTYSFEVNDLLSGDPVVLARTCVFGVPDIPCTMVDETDATGTIEVPINSEIQLVTTALRYFPELTTYTTTEEPRDVDIDLGKESNVVPLLVAAGVTADPEKGQLAWLAQTGPGMGLEGVTATLVGTGEGPFYTLDSLPSMEQMETSEDGLGIFANVDPGRVEVVYNNPFGDCTFSEGWAGSAPNQVATNVEPGHLTIIIAFCDGPPAGDAGTDMDAGDMDAGTADAGMDAGT